MKITPLTLDHLIPWSQLLAACFNRRAEDMAHLLRFLQPESRLIAWGVWDGDLLAAQYSCWLTAVHHPGCLATLPVGMSINMAVHPAYRGRGLIKQVAEPVYATLVERGAVAGVGFSNAQGVQVDRHSKGYGYEVVGQLRPSLFYLRRGLGSDPLSLTSQWPIRPFVPFSFPKNHCFHHTPETLHHRFGQHPFRQYRFGV
jgi:GNAT superfamily N-acetyltransferase